MQQFIFVVLFENFKVLHDAQQSLNAIQHKV